MDLGPAEEAAAGLFLGHDALAEPHLSVRVDHHVGGHVGIGLEERIDLRFEHRTQIELVVDVEVLDAGADRMRGFTLTRYRPIR